MASFEQPTFVTFACDCIGIRCDGMKDITIWHCDAQWDECALSPSIRDQGDKTAEPLPTERVWEMMLSLGKLAADGHDLRKIRIHLGVKQ